ncbi:MAG: flagellar protein FlaG [Lachnospiraceae bacterium]|nr:flagellar protein FlaG [Lachnospiraceae bacterium]
MELTTNMNVNSAYQGQGSSKAANVSSAKENIQVDAAQVEENRPLTGEEGKVATKEQLHNAVQEINKKANGVEAVFGMDDESNRVYIKIVDKASDKTIVQYPAEETLKLINRVWADEGLTVDEKR